MEDLQKKIENILNGYKILDKNILNIKEDVSNLDAMHKKLLGHVENRNEFNTFGFYIDDVFFHKKILEHQLINITTLRNMSFRKLYGDLFRLYVRVTKKIAELDNELHNKEVNYIKEFHIDNKIKKFNELENFNIYDEKDVILLCEYLFTYMNSLNKFVEDINNHIKKLEEKNREGYKVNTYIVGLVGEKNKLDVDINIAKRILEMVLEMHEKFVNKHSEYCKMVASEIMDNQMYDNDLDLKSPKTTMFQNLKNEIRLKTPSNRISSKYGIDNIQINTTANTGSGRSTPKLPSISIQESKDNIIHVSPVTPITTQLVPSVASITIQSDQKK